MIQAASYAVDCRENCVVVMKLACRLVNAEQDGAGGTKVREAKTFER